MSEVLRLPVWMAPAAQEAIRQDRWRTQPNPIAYVKTATHRIAVRMGLNEDEYKGPVDRSRKCPCGLMSKSEALESGHACVAGEVDAFNLKLPDLSDSKYFTGSRFDACDWMEQPGLHQLVPGACDSGELWEFVEDGISYVVSRLLCSVDPEFTYLETRVADASAESQADGERPPVDSFQVLAVDWQKVAKKLGFDENTATVMDLRFALGWSREQVVASARGQKQRRDYETAWRRITSHSQEIRALLLDNPQNQAFEERMARTWNANHGPIGAKAKRESPPLHTKSFLTREGEFDDATRLESKAKRFAVKKPGRTLMQDGNWLIPESDRPKSREK